MNTIMFIQNIEYSYIMVSWKYTNFATFFFSWDKECWSQLDFTLNGITVASRVSNYFRAMQWLHLSQTESDFVLIHYKRKQ